MTAAALRFSAFEEFPDIPTPQTGIQDMDIDGIDHEFEAAIDAVFRLHDSGQSVNARGKGSVQEALITLSQELRDFGIASNLAERFVAAIERHAIHEGVKVAHNGGFKKVSLSVIDQKPDLDPSDNHVMIAWDRRGRHKSEFSRAEVHLTNRGTTTSATRIPNFEELFSTGSEKYLIVHFEKPKGEGDESLDQAGLDQATLLEAVGPQAAGSIEGQKMMAQVEQGTITPETMALAETVAKINAPQPPSAEGASSNIITLGTALTKNMADMPPAENMPRIMMQAVSAAFEKTLPALEAAASVKPPADNAPVSEAITASVDSSLGSTVVAPASIVSPDVGTTPVIAQSSAAPVDPALANTSADQAVIMADLAIVDTKITLIAETSASPSTPILSVVSNEVETPLVVAPSNNSLGNQAVLSETTGSTPAVVVTAASTMKSAGAVEIAADMEVSSEKTSTPQAKENTASVQPLDSASVPVQTLNEGASINSSPHAMIAETVGAPEKPSSSVTAATTDVPAIAKPIDKESAASAPKTPNADTASSMLPPIASSVITQTADKPALPPATSTPPTSIVADHHDAHAPTTASKPPAAESLAQTLDSLASPTRLVSAPENVSPLVVADAPARIATASVLSDAPSPLKTVAEHIGGTAPKAPTVEPSTHIQGDRTATLTSPSIATAIVAEPKTIGLEPTISSSDAAKLNRSVSPTSFNAPATDAITPTKFKTPDLVVTPSAASLDASPSSSPAPVSSVTGVSPASGETSAPSKPQRLFETTIPAGSPAKADQPSSAPYKPASPDPVAIPIPTKSVVFAITSDSGKPNADTKGGPPIIVEIAKPVVLSNLARQAEARTSPPPPVTNPVLNDSSYRVTLKTSDVGNPQRLPISPNSEITSTTPKTNVSPGPQGTAEATTPKTPTNTAPITVAVTPPPTTPTPGTPIRPVTFSISTTTETKPSPTFTGPPVSVEIAKPIKQPEFSQSPTLIKPATNAERIPSEPQFKIQNGQGQSFIKQLENLAQSHGGSEKARAAVDSLAKDIHSGIPISQDRLERVVRDLGDGSRDVEKEVIREINRHIEREERKAEVQPIESIKLTFRKCCELGCAEGSPCKRDFINAGKAAEAELMGSRVKKDRLTATTKAGSELTGDNNNEQTLVNKKTNTGSVPQPSLVA